MGKKLGVVVFSLCVCVCVCGCVWFAEKEAESRGIEKEENMMVLIRFIGRGNTVLFIGCGNCGTAGAPPSNGMGPFLLTGQTISKYKLARRGKKFYI